MKSSSENFGRLLNALDDLVWQEAVTVKSGDYQAVRSIQLRAEPLVNALAALGPDRADKNARAKIANLLARRQHSIDFIESQLATARDELLALQESATRVAQIAPVYGRPQSRSASGKFSARG